MAQSFTRAEIYELVWSMTMLKVGERLYISSSYLKRLCTQHDIPTPPPGYWNKLAHGKPVEKRPALPKRADEAPIVIYGEPPQSAAIVDPEALSLEEALCRVPKVVSIGQLRDPHRLVQDEIEYARKQTEKRRRDPPGESWGKANPTNPDVERRRLLILNALLKGLEAMGFAVERAPNGYRATYMEKERGSIDFSLYERSRQTWISDPPPRTKWEKLLWRDRRLKLEPTGHLLLQLQYPRGQAPQRWEEPKRMLDEHLSEILASFEVHRHADLVEGRREAERAERIAERQRVLREERQRREQEEEGWRRFESRAETWARVSRLRKFLAAIEAEGLRDQLDIDGRSVSEWLAWARSHIDLLDPLKEGSHRVFRGLLTPGSDDE